MPMIIRPFHPRFQECGPASPNTGDLFSALILRSSPDPGGEYLCLQGAASPYSPCGQANDILRLTWGSRIVLAGEDALPRRCASGLHIARNGEHFPSLEPARLEANALFRHSGFCRTLLENDNGMAWERNIIWCPGHFIVLLDACAALADAAFTVEARWIIPEEAYLAGRALHLYTDSPRFALISADRSNLVLADLGAFPAGRRPESSSLKILRQTLCRPMKTGDTLAFMNLISPVQDNALSFERIGDSVALIGGKHPCLLGRADEGWAGGDIEIRATLFTLSQDGFSGIGLSKAAIERKELFSSSHPVHVEADVRRGDMAVECLQVTDLIVRAQAARWQGRAFTADRSGLLRIRLPRGRHELALSEMAGIRSLSSRPQEAAKNGPRPAAIALDLAFDTSLWQARLGSRVSDADAYGNLLAVGGERGDILLLDPWGQSKARIHTGSPIVRLAIAPGAASGMTGVLTGTEDAALALYTLDGECVWRKGLGPGYRQQARRACSLACACGNSPFFLAGLADGSLMAFSAEGAELWQARLSHYPATFLAAIRQEGNGFNIVAGSATAGMYLLDDEGQVLWRSMRGPVLAAAAMVSGGQREIVSGGACGLQGFRQESGETTREINLGGEIIALTAHPADPILYAASSIGQIAAIAPDSILWRIDAGEPVSCMAYAGSHDPSLALGTPGGHIRFHSPADGHLRAVTPASDPVRSLHSGPGILWSVGGAGRIEGVGCSAAP